MNKSRLGLLFRHTQYKQAGFDSFADYMNERQPCGIKMRHAYELIAAMKLRPLLPDCATGAKNEPSVWTERAIRPLLHKDFTPADQKRIPHRALQATKGQSASEETWWRSW